MGKAIMKKEKGKKTASKSAGSWVPAQNPAPQPGDRAEPSCAFCPGSTGHSAYIGEEHPTGCSMCWSLPTTRLRRQEKPGLLAGLLGPEALPGLGSPTHRAGAQCSPASWLGGGGVTTWRLSHPPGVDKDTKKNLFLQARQRTKEEQRANSLSIDATQTWTCRAGKWGRGGEESMHTGRHTRAHSKTDTYTCTHAHTQIHTHAHTDTHTECVLG